MVADRKRELIQNTVLILNGRNYNVTVSCGVTQFKNGDTTGEILKRAEAALLQAKAIPGKNATCSIF